LPNVPKIKDAESENIFVSISADTTWSAVFRPHFGTINSPSRNMCTPLVLAKRKLTNWPTTEVHPVTFKNKAGVVNDHGETPTSTRHTVSNKNDT